MSIASNLVRTLSAAIVMAWFAPLSYSVDALRRPVLLILSGDGGEILATADSLPRLATTGREAYAGETLEAGSAEITFAYCPGTTDRASTYTLAARAAIQITKESLPAAPGLRHVTDLPVCQLPQLDAVPLASTLNEPVNPSITTTSLDSRISRLSPADQSSLRQKLRLSDALMHGDSALVGHATRAALLAQFGLIDDALVELRTIRERWTGALWTRNAISRLTRTRIIKPDLSAELDSSPGLIAESAKPNCNSAAGKSYALLIGISRYESDKIPPLHFADQDAKTFEQYLKSARGGRLPSEQVKLLLNNEATRDGIEGGLAELIRGKANCSNTLIVFIAAHGMLGCTQTATGGAGAVADCDSNMATPYILTYDSDFSEAKTSGIPMAELRDLVTSRAKDFGRVFLFVDVCHAGRIGALPDATHLNSSEVSDTFGRETGMLGILMGNSRARSPQAELTYERSTYGHGIFTFYTLLGLNQGVEPSHDGKVYFSDLSTYVAAQVLRATDHKQWPSAISADPSLVAVDDATQRGIALTIPTESGDPDIPRGAVHDLQPDLIAKFENSLSKGRLLPGDTDNAFDLLHQILQFAPEWGLCSFCEAKAASGPRRERSIGHS